MKKFNYRQYLAEGWMFKEALPGKENGEGSFSRESNQNKVAIVLSYTTKIRSILRVAGHTLDLSDYEGWDEMDPTKGILIDGTPLSEYTDNKALQQIVSGIMRLPDFGSESFREDYGDQGLGLHEEEQGSSGVVDADIMGFYYSRGYVCSGITNIQCKVLQNTLPKTENELPDMKIEDPEYKYGEGFVELWEHPEFEEFYILDITVGGKTIYSAPGSPEVREEMGYILKDGDASRYPDVEEELKRRVGKQ